MNRITTNAFELDPMTDAQGKVTINSDNIAMGLMVSLMGFFASVMFLAIFLGLGNPAHWYDNLWQEPFHFDSREINQKTEELNRQLLKADPDATPLPAMPIIVRHEAGGFNWGALGILLMDHAFIIGGAIAGVLGIRIMFTGTKIVFDTHAMRVEWIRSGIRRKTYRQYTLSELSIILYPVIIRDWHGFAATIVSKNRDEVQLARCQTMEELRQYAHKFQAIVKIEVKEIGAEPEG